MRKQNHFFPIAGSLPKSTAAHTSVASKRNKKAPAPASRLALVFLPHFCGCLCTPEMLAPPWAPGCPQSKLGAALCRCRGSPRWEASSGTAAHAWHSPKLGHPGLPRAWVGAGGGNSWCLPHSEVPWACINGIVNCLTDKTLAPQKPGLPKTRAYLFIHDLHLIFSMLFSGGKKILAKKTFWKFSSVFFHMVEYVCFFFPSGSEMKKTFFDFVFKINSV